MQEQQKDSSTELQEMEPTVAKVEIPPLRHEPNICAPISALAHVWTYMQNPPKWTNRIIDLMPRSSLVVKNSRTDCHVESDQFAPRTRLDRQSVPRTLVCHDMKGGYLEDKFIGPTNVGNGYAFYRWSQIDVFVYFSHHLITIPPLSWINVAHTNGVKILGTFITEWNPGREICQQIFTDRETLQMFVNILVDVCVLFKLDGWLLNIENNLEDTTLLKEFLKCLTEKLHAKRPGSLVIWYDSVIHDGKLKWQNELNSLNRCFFDLCDGIFLNYTWNESNIKNTVKAAEHRCLDVYVGVDVFGRNSYGGGNFNTYLAAEKIRQYNLSMAIFAQAWTHETLNREPYDTLLERFLNRDNAFWRSLWPYLYTHPITTAFQTFFYVGVDQNWFKLHSQEVQLSHFLHSKECLPEDTNVPTLAGTCNCLQLHLHGSYTSCFVTNKTLNPEVQYVHRLFSTDVQVSGNIIVYHYTKNTEVSNRNDYLSLILLVKHLNGTFRKVICNSMPKEILEDNFSVLEVNPSKDQDIINMVTYQHRVPSDWVLRCYLLNISSSRILEIGAKIDRWDSVCLCGIGFRDAAIFGGGRYLN